MAIKFEIVADEKGIEITGPGFFRLITPDGGAFASDLHYELNRFTKEAVKLGYLRKRVFACTCSSSPASCLAHAKDVGYGTEAW
jgi:hypothetical protein